MNPLCLPYEKLMGQLAVSQRDEKGELVQAEATKLVKNLAQMGVPLTSQSAGMLLAIIDVQGRPSWEEFLQCVSVRGGSAIGPRAAAARGAGGDQRVGRALRQQRPGRDRARRRARFDGARSWRARGADVLEPKLWRRIIARER